MEFTKKEITYLLVASIIAGFVFSFDEWGTDVFNLSIGLTNLLKATTLVLIIYTVHTFSQKLIAKKSSCDLEFDLITTEKIPLTHIIIPKGFKFTGPLITLIFSLVSNGKLIFVALASFKSKVNRKKRIGHQWTNLKDIEEANIAAAGPISNVCLLLIFKILLPFSQSFFSKGMFIASSLAIFHMLPLPKYDGIKIWAGSRTLYIALFCLIILVIAFTYLINVLAAVILALILTIAITSFYFYSSNK